MKSQAKHAGRLSIALATAVLVATWTSEPSVAKSEWARDIAVKKCGTQARGRYGGNYVNWDQPRIFAYETCMRNEGFPP
jgi:hypothetical protein